MPETAVCYWGNSKMKKKLKIEEAEKIEKVESIEIKVERVSPFHFEFNNEGLNQLKDKVNELVEFLNK